jgi:hypothetical protein
MACEGVKRSACWVLVGKSEGKNPSEELDVYGRMNIKWVLTFIGLDVWTRL